MRLIIVGVRENGRATAQHPSLLAAPSGHRDCAVVLQQKVCQPLATPVNRVSDYAEPENLRAGSNDCQAIGSPAMRWSPSPCPAGATGTVNPWWAPVQDPPRFCGRPADGGVIPIGIRVDPCGGGIPVD